MSLSLSKSLVSKLPVSVNAVTSAFNKAVVTKRNLSRTTPNQFLFGKKPAKFNVEKLHIPNPSWKMGVPQKVPVGTSVEYSPNEIKDMLTFLMGTVNFYFFITFILILIFYYYYFQISCNLIFLIEIKITNSKSEMSNFLKFI